MTKTFYIYGAGIVAASIYTAIRELYNYTPIAFLVSEKEGNPSEIDGIPVLTLSQNDAIDNNAKYLIATPGIHHAMIVKSLCHMGIGKEQLVLVDNRLENMLMERYYCRVKEFNTVSQFLESDENGNKRSNDEGALQKDGILREIVVYQVKSNVDKPLNERISIPEYITPLQVGAALTDEVIADIQDKTGENISHKNRNYCELTGTYYAWKNSDAGYKGLCHYRRIWDVPKEKLKALLTGDVDAVLPYPSVHYPDISGQHERYVSDIDWNAMLSAMQEVAPAYYRAYLEDVSKQRYFYNYNMVIAKKEVFDDYCSFLFSVLERTEELTTPKGWERRDRFAGYLGENLTTIYFRKNCDKLKIVHAGKWWLT